MKGFDLRIIGNCIDFGDIDFLETHRFKDGISFPDSYKEFVKEYGYGLTMEQFLIYIPMGNYGDSWIVRTKEIRATYHNDLINNDIWFDIEPDGNLELIKRLVPFASSENGYYLFWDPESLNQKEFDVYITDFRGVGFRKAGTSLYDVIENLTSYECYKDVLPFLQEPLPRTFRSLTRYSSNQHL